MRHSIGDAERIPSTIWNEQGLYRLLKELKTPVRFSDRHL